MVLPSDLQIHLVIQQVNDYRFTHAIWSTRVSGRGMPAFTDCHFFPDASLACLAYDYRKLGLVYPSQ